MALLIAYHLLEGVIERVVIVTPTEHLKRQWAEAAALIGIDIDCAWANASGRESSDYFGVAVTYHQVGFAPDLYDLNCRRKTLVIFDEIHHAGDSLDWGDQAPSSVSPCRTSPVFIGNAVQIGRASDSVCQLLGQSKPGGFLLRLRRSVS